MGTIAAALQMAAKTLRSRSSSPQLAAEVLLCKVLGTTRAARFVRGAESGPAPSRRGGDVPAGFAAPKARPAGLPCRAAPPP